MDKVDFLFKIKTTDFSSVLKINDETNHLKKKKNAKMLLYTGFNISTVVTFSWRNLNLLYLTKT